MPRGDGISVAQFSPSPTSTDRLASTKKVFGGRILSKGDSDGAPAYIQIANTWLLVNPGRADPDKPTVTL